MIRAFRKVETPERTWQIELHDHRADRPPGQRRTNVGSVILWLGEVDCHFHSMEEVRAAVHLGGSLHVWTFPQLAREAVLELVAELEGTGGH
jgi:hypothetical protein